MISNKKEMYKNLLDQFSDQLGNNGCNDFEVANTPELYQLFEESAARNLHCTSVEEFRKHPEYKDYKPRLSKNGKSIVTQDYTALEILQNELDCR